MCGALLVTDILQSDETKLPSVDNWGTCGRSAGRALFSFACHRLKAWVNDTEAQLAFLAYSINGVYIERLMLALDSVWRSINSLDDSHGVPSREVQIQPPDSRSSLTNLKGAC